jgi:predicted 2-oxoglutarate/Fe(II)-dependent dioxygenase YbiX
MVFSDVGDEGRRLAEAVRRAGSAAQRVFVVSVDADHLDDDTFHDPDRGVHAAYGIDAGSGPSVLVLDRNVRVSSVHRSCSPDEATGIADAASALAVQVPAEPAARHAPVLLVPDALDAGLRDRLVAAWHAADPVATGVETMADGRHVEALDDLRKRRRDHVVTDPELLRTLTQHVGRRVIPEVQKAFAFSATRFEGFKLGCYTADDAGFFDAHRDNLSAATAHRRFALSINLADDFEGGELCFPEYGRQLYRPDPGEALVFSGAHLHEVRPVTAGRRFVLLSFLF